MKKPENAKKYGKYKNKKSFRKMIHPIFLGLILTVSLAFVLSIYFSQEEEFAKLNEKHQTLAEQAEEMREKKQEMLDLLNNWNTPEYIERIAREQFGLVKSGEVVFED